MGSSACLIDCGCCTEEQWKCLARKKREGHVRIGQTEEVW